MKLRESDPLVMLSGVILGYRPLCLVIAGLLIAHNWK